MKYRSPLAVFFLTFITFGIYGLVWYVQTKEEMRNLGISIPTAWLLFIPFGNFYWFWRYSEAVEDLTDGRSSALGVFLLNIMLGPIGIAITQSILNNVRDEAPWLEEGDIRIMIQNRGA